MIIFENLQFKDWQLLNDTIMGGNSYADISPTDSGLILNGYLVEEGGGFISCRSPILTPPLNLSKFKGFIIKIEAKGASLKLAVSCKNNLLRFPGFLNKGLKWVTVFNTNDNGVSIVKILFKDLKPSIRAKKVLYPFAFNSSSVDRIQILYSKFGMPGKTNNLCKAGPVNIILKSISVY